MPEKTLEIGRLLPRGGFVFGAPGRYIQGPGALDLLGEVLQREGRRALLLADAFVAGMIGPRMIAVCEAAGVSATLHPFAGEITYEAVAGVIAAQNDASFSVVAGIGGGKTLDAAKAVALQLGLGVVTVPTIASNDSPTSATIAMYGPDHSMVAIDRLPASPLAVLVDSELIAAAPLQFLRAGIGDAVSKKFEAEGCHAGTGVTPFGTRPGLCAIAIADGCYRVLRAHALPALQALAEGRLTPDVEATIEATLLMSGLGFENGGLSLAHSLTRGLVKLRGARDAIHGAHISWGALVQCAADGQSDNELRDLAGFLAEVGLPVTLRGLGLTDPSPDELQELARWTMTAPHLANLASPIDEAGILAAIDRVERLSNHA